MGSDDALTYKYPLMRGEAIDRGSVIICVLCVRGLDLRIAMADRKECKEIMQTIRYFTDREWIRSRFKVFTRNCKSYSNKEDQEVIIMIVNRK